MKTAESKAARANLFFLSKKEATIAIIGKQTIINRKQVTEMSSLIEEETRRILTEALQATRAILTAHRGALEGAEQDAAEAVGRLMACVPPNLNDDVTVVLLRRLASASTPPSVRAADSSTWRPVGSAQSHQLQQLAIHRGGRL